MYDFTFKHNDHTFFLVNRMDKDQGVEIHSADLRRKLMSITPELEVLNGMGRQIGSAYLLATCAEVRAFQYGPDETLHMELCSDERDTLDNLAMHLFRLMQTDTGTY